MSSKFEPAICSRDTGQRIPFFERSQLIITWLSNIKEVHSKQGSMRDLARLCHHHHHCAHASTSNTATHDNHEKINQWISFSFLYEYGAAVAGPSGRRSSSKTIRKAFTLTPPTAKTGPLFLISTLRCFVLVYLFCFYCFVLLLRKVK